MKPLRGLAPLVPIYGGLVHAKNVAFDSGLLSAARLKQPVISIGNLSTGGSGKTPVVIALAHLLAEHGVSVDVLSRGYGRTSGKTLLVSGAGDADAHLYGDEPMMIARATGMPVFVGRSRYKAGMLAEQSALIPNYIHLLDDGFQHRQLARDLDVVVLHAADVTSRLLPAGDLREPLSSLRRAQVVVVREEDRDAFSIHKYLRTDAQLWTIQRRLVLKVPGGPVAAFCGIARPQEFFTGLRSVGVEVAASLAFADHHHYGEADLEMLLDACSKAKAVSLVTTEKDAVRLGPSASAALNDVIPLKIARLETTFLEPEAVLKTVRGLMEKHVANR